MERDDILLHRILRDVAGASGPLDGLDYPGYEKDKVNWHIRWAQLNGLIDATTEDTPDGIHVVRVERLTPMGDDFLDDLLNSEEGDEETRDDLDLEGGSAA